MKHIIVKWAPALIIVIAALASPTAAHETDQYTLPEGRVVTIFQVSSNSREPESS